MSTLSNCTPPARRRLLQVTGAAVLGAAAVFTLLVLPAEFGKDPTGFGRLSGLTRLSQTGPAEEVVAAPAGDQAPARFPARAYRSDVVEIRLNTMDAGLGGEDLEYKVRMSKGDTLVYDWVVTGIDKPAEFFADFHGETPPNPKVQVVEYRRATGLTSHGSLTAPMDGIHGWYLQNQSSKPVTVRLRLSGFYDLVPPGQKGNESNITPMTKPGA